MFKTYIYFISLISNPKDISIESELPTLPQSYIVHFWHNSFSLLARVTLIVVDFVHRLKSCHPCDGLTTIQRERVSTKIDDWTDILELQIIRWVIFRGWFSIKKLKRTTSNKIIYISLSIVCLCETLIKII